MGSRFAQNSGRSHTKAVKDILQYLSGSRTRGITFGGKDGDLKITGYSKEGDLKITGYSDSAWAGDLTGRK